MGNRFWKTYGSVVIMLLAMVAGCVVGVMWPGATALRPLGTVFINMMFCLVVPLVFASIAASVANMPDRRKMGRIMGISILSFFATGILAALIMYGLVLLFPPVLNAWENLPQQEMGEYATLSQMIVNFLTTEDFVGLLSRRAILPLIVFSLLFGFSVNLCGGKETAVGQWLDSLSTVMLRLVKLVSYYAPVAFFGFFADLVATYGPQITADYGRAMALYYPLSFAYLLLIFPLFAMLGAGKRGLRQMVSHMWEPALVSLGTCSSVATIPANLTAAQRSGIRREVSEILLPLGSTMHMDGSGLACVLKVAFLYGVFGKELTLATLLPVVLVSVLAAVGTSGVPGGGYIGEYLICVFFFPEQMALAFPILVTIGNLVDPPATMLNAAGDYAISFLVERLSFPKKKS